MEPSSSCPRHLRDHPGAGGAGGAGGVVGGVGRASSKTRPPLRRLAPSHDLSSGCFGKEGGREGERRGEERGRAAAVPRRKSLTIPAPDRLYLRPQLMIPNVLARRPLRLLLLLLRLLSLFLYPLSLSLIGVWCAPHGLLSLALPPAAPRGGRQETDRLTDGRTDAEWKETRI